MDDMNGSANRNVGSLCWIRSCLLRHMNRADLIWELEFWIWDFNGRAIGDGLISMPRIKR